MDSAPTLYTRVTTWFLALGVLGLILAEAYMSRGRLEPVAAELVCLAIGAAATAWAAASGTAASPRLAQTFVLAALMLLPAPGAALVAAAGCLGGRAAGVAGPAPRSAGSVFAVLVAVSAAQFFHLPGTDPLYEGTLPVFAEIAGLWIVVQGFSLGVGALVVGGRSSRAALVPDRLRLGLEGINVPLAWILVTLTAAFGVVPLVIFGGLTYLAGLLLRSARRTSDELRTHEDALQSRVTELATLHAISREILSTVDPERIYGIVDRECAKIFRFDALFIALADRDTRDLRVVHRRRTGEPPVAGPPPASRGLAAWILEEKRGLRIDDLREDRPPLPRDPALLEPDCASVLAVPLIVEGEALGVLCLQSRTPGAYDDHLLSVLTTIAQQAAVAIENARHYEMATVDSLTGLFLRPYFFRRLEEEYQRARRYRGSFAVLMMDLDGFKEINDHHGHLVGDRYLRALGATVKDRLRGADLACRYGGDEFCLLLPETDLEGARAIAERIRSAVAELVVHVDTLAVRTTTSIGVSAYPEHATEDAKSLILKADEALYRAKRLGRDRVVPPAA